MRMKTEPICPAHQHGEASQAHQRDSCREDTRGRDTCMPVYTSRAHSHNQTSGCVAVVGPPGDGPAPLAITSSPLAPTVLLWASLPSESCRNSDSPHYCQWSRRPFPIEEQGGGGVGVKQVGVRGCGHFSEPVTQDISASLRSLLHQHRLQYSDKRQQYQQPTCVIDIS